VVVVLTWDEGAKPGSGIGTRYDHYSLLETTENMVGLTTCLGHAAVSPPGTSGPTSD
jgi:hypothetical protein